MSGIEDEEGTQINSLKVCRSEVGKVNSRLQMTIGKLEEGLDGL